MLKSLSKLFISSALLCATVFALNAQGHATSSRTSGPSTSKSVILCMPGFVYRCNQFGCFCVRP